MSDTEIPVVLCVNFFYFIIFRNLTRRYLGTYKESSIYVYIVANGKVRSDLRGVPRPHVARPSVARWKKSARSPTPGRTVNRE